MARPQPFQTIVSGHQQTVVPGDGSWSIRAHHGSGPSGASFDSGRNFFPGGVGGRSASFGQVQRSPQPASFHSEGGDQYLGTRACSFDTGVGGSSFTVPARPAYPQDQRQSWQQQAKYSPLQQQKWPPQQQQQHRQQHARHGGGRHRHPQTNGSHRGETSEALLKQEHLGQQSLGQGSFGRKCLYCALACLLVATAGVGVLFARWSDVEKLGIVELVLTKAPEVLHFGDVPAVSSSTTGIPVATAPLYDCSGDMSEWTLSQQYWCCKKERIGCATPPSTTLQARSSAATVASSTASSKAAGVPMRFVPGGSADRAEAPRLSTSYSAQAEPTTPLLEANASATLLEQTGAEASSAGCGAVCSLNGHSVTCRSRMEYSVKHQFVGQPFACAKAHTLLLQQCPVCDGCSLEELKCLKPKTSNEQVISRATACQSLCKYGGRPATCAARVRYAANKVTYGRRNVCESAYALVVEHCNVCSACSLEATGCKEQKIAEEAATAAAFAASAVGPEQE